MRSNRRARDLGRWLVVGLLVPLTVPGLSRAQGPSPSPSGGAPRGSATTPPRSSAIGAVADEIASLLPGKGGAFSAIGALVVVAPPKSDLPLLRADELALRIAQVASGKLGARAHDKTATLSVARGLAGRATGLVFLQPEIEKGELRVIVDAYPAVTNGWERLKNPLPGPRAHGFAHAAIDAEVRAFMPPILIEQAKVARSLHREGEVLAVACGDVDADGGLELVLVSRARVAVGRLGPTGLVVEKTALLRDVAARLPVPFREPLGTAFVVHGGPSRDATLFVGTTDRGGVALGPDLAVRHALVGLPVAVADAAEGGGLCASIAADHASFDGLAPCASHAERAGLTVAATGLATGLPSRFDAVSALSYVDAGGRPHEAVAAREPSGRLKVRVDGAELLTQEGAGAQVLLADLDLDGTPELVTTADAGDDRVVVSSLGAGGRARLRLDAKEGVRALAACPAELGGKPALVAVVGQEVWLVR